MDEGEGTIDLLKHFDLLPYIDVLEEFFQKLIAQGGLSSKHIPYWFTLDNLLYYADIDADGVMKIHLPSTTKTREAPQSKFSSASLKLRDKALPAPRPENSQLQAPAYPHHNPGNDLAPKIEQFETPLYFPTVQPAPVNPIEPIFSPSFPQQPTQTYPAPCPDIRNINPTLEAPARSNNTKDISTTSKKVSVKKEQPINTVSQRYITNSTQTGTSNFIASQLAAPPDIKPSLTFDDLFDEAQSADAILEDPFFNLLETADLSEPVESTNATRTPIVANSTFVSTSEVTDTTNGIFASNNRAELPRETQKVKKEPVSSVSISNKAPLISTSIKKEPNATPGFLSKPAVIVKKEPQGPLRISRALTATTCQPSSQNREHSNINVSSHPPTLAPEPTGNDTAFFPSPIASTNNNKAPGGRDLDPLSIWKQNLLLKKAHEKTALTGSSGAINSQDTNSDEQPANSLKENIGVSNNTKIPQVQKEPNLAKMPERVSQSQSDNNTRTAVQKAPIEKDNNITSSETSRLRVTQVFLQHPRQDFLNNQGSEQHSRPSVFSRLSFAPAGSHVDYQPSAFASSQKSHAQKNYRDQQSNVNVRHAPFNRHAASENHSTARSTLYRPRLNPAFNKAIAELRTHANLNPNSSAQREHASGVYSRLGTYCSNNPDKHVNHATTSKMSDGWKAPSNPNKQIVIDLTQDTEDSCYYDSIPAKRPISERISFNPNNAKSTRFNKDTNLASMRGNNFEMSTEIVSSSFPGLDKNPPTFSSPTLLSEDMFSFSDNGEISDAADDSDIEEIDSKDPFFVLKTYLDEVKQNIVSEVAHFNKLPDVKGKNIDHAFLIHWSYYRRLSDISVPDEDVFALYLDYFVSLAYLGFNFKGSSEKYTKRLLDDQYVYNFSSIDNPLPYADPPRYIGWMKSAWTICSFVGPSFYLNSESCLSLSKFVAVAESGELKEFLQQEGYSESYTFNDWDFNKFKSI